MMTNSREACSYNFPGGCTEKCHLKSLFEQHIGDKGLHGEEGKQRAEQWQQAATEAECPEAYEIDLTRIPEEGVDWSGLL